MLHTNVTTVTESTGEEMKEETQNDLFQQVEQAACD